MVATSNARLEEEGYAPACLVRARTGSWDAARERLSGAAASVGRSGVMVRAGYTTNVFDARGRAERPCAT